MQRTVISEGSALIQWRMDAKGDVFTVVEWIAVNTVISTSPSLVTSLRDLHTSAMLARVRSGVLRTNTLEIRDFVNKTVMELSQQRFDELKEHLLGEYMLFWRNAPFRRSSVVAKQRLAV